MLGLRKGEREKGDEVENDEQGVVANQRRRHAQKTLCGCWKKLKQRERKKKPEKQNFGNHKQF
jgi:hypothetical protein